MKRPAFVMRLVVTAVWASLAAVVRRVRRGPTLPTWTWSEELFVAGSRAALAASARHIDLVSLPGGGPKPPLGRAARGALTVEKLELRGVRAERYRPATPSGTILYFHGGGFVSGSVALQRRQAATLAMDSACDTFSIDYRLAPRHPFPAALDDAIDAYRALLDRGANPASTVFVGGSAGACLALSALLQIRSLALPRPAGAVLLGPYADFTFSGDTLRTNGGIDILPVRDLAPLWGPAYVGDADPSDPLVSPALADLNGLPPLLIMAGGAESLLSCAERIAANARQAGVDAQFTVYPEKVHEWMLLSKLPATKEALEEIRRWISAVIATDR